MKKTISIFIIALFVLGIITQTNIVSATKMTAEPTDQYKIYLDISNELITPNNVIFMNVYVADINGNPVNDAEVTFSASDLKGYFVSVSSSSQNPTLKTDQYGYVTMKWMPTEVSQGNIRVDVTFNGLKYTKQQTIKVIAPTVTADGQESQTVTIEPVAARTQTMPAVIASSSSGAGGYAPSIQTTQTIKVPIPSTFQPGVSISPSWQEVHSGDKAIYTVTVTDNRPQCNVGYIYDENDNNGEKTVMPRCGEQRSYMLTATDLPFSWFISEDKKTVEEATDQYNEATRVAPSATLFPGESKTLSLVIFTHGGDSKYDFLVYAIPQATGSGATKGYGKATLHVTEDEVTPPTTPPDFPDGKEIKMGLKKGWNLVSIPSPLVKFVKQNGEKKLVAFIYLAPENKYVTLQEAQKYLGSDFESYMASRAFWIYSYDSQNLRVIVEGNEGNSVSLTSGWNLVPVRQSFLGQTLNNLGSGCGFISAYGWNAEQQEWTTVGTDYTFKNKDLGTGYIAKASNYCTLTGDNTPPVIPPDYPEECSGEGDVCGGGLNCCTGYTCTWQKYAELRYCKKTNCVTEGGSIPVVPNHANCCVGLTLIKPKSQDLIGSYGYCTSKCGNGVCDSATESSYNCPSDCNNQGEKKALFESGRGNGPYDKMTYAKYISKILFTPTQDMVITRISPDIWYCNGNCGFEIIVDEKDGMNINSEGVGGEGITNLDGTVATFPLQGGHQYIFTMTAKSTKSIGIYTAGSGDKSNTYGKYSIISIQDELTGDHSDRGPISFTLYGKLTSVPSPGVSCMDTDGQNYLTFGYIEVKDTKGIVQPFMDTCESTGQVVEMTCNNNQAQKVWFPCQNYGSDYTCQNGACVSTSPTQTCSNTGQYCGGITGTQCCSGTICKLDGNYPDAGGICVSTQVETCTDSDGQNFLTSGYVTTRDKYGRGQSIPDSCEKTQVKEQICNNGKAQIVWYPCQNYGSDYTCQNGACSIKAEPAPRQVGTMACPNGGTGTIYERDKLGGSTWQNLKLDTSQQPNVAEYRIQWYNGKWSPWYFPGKWDVDWKTNNDGSARRAWSYFDDHTHQYLVCPNPRQASVQDGGTRTASCSDSDGAFTSDTLGTLSYTAINGETGTLTDYCVDSSTVGEYYCNTGTTQAGFSTIACANGCSNGACTATSGGSPLIMKTVYEPDTAGG